MKKTVLDIPMISSPKFKARMLSTVAKLEGVNEISSDAEKGKVTIIGTVDPVQVVTELRKVACGKAAVTIDIIEAYKKPDPPKPPPKPDPPKPDPPKPCCPEPCHGPPQCGYPVTLEMLVPCDNVGPNTICTIL